MNVAYWIAIIQAVLAVMAFLVGLQSPDVKRRKMQLNLFLGLLVVATLFGLMLIRKSERDEEYLKNLLSEANKNALAQADSQASTAASKSAQSADDSAKAANHASLRSEKETSDARSEAREASAKLQEAVDASDSSCYIDLTPTGGNQGSFSMFVAHIGEHTLHDVSGYVVDVLSLIKVRDSTMTGLQKSLALSANPQPYNIGELLVGTGKQLGSIQFIPRDDRYDLNFFFLAANGQWREEYRARRTTAGWKHAIRVLWQQHKGEKEKSREIFDDGYPRNADG